MSELPAPEVGRRDGMTAGARAVSNALQEAVVRCQRCAARMEPYHRWCRNCGREKEHGGL